MRAVSLMVLLLLGSLWVSQGQQGEPPKKARLEGIVVSLTGEPVPRAQLRLVGTATIAAPASGKGAAKSASPAVTTAPSNVSATSDDAGKFVIENIDPGRNYQLTAQRPGFVNTRYGARSATAPGSPLTLDAGADLKGLVITMTPQGVISGKVTDQAGDPVQNALVALMRRGYQRGMRQLVPMNTFSTNDQGEYRLANLPPGKYYVVVTDRVNITGLGAANTESGRLGNIPTYYPTAIDPQAALALDVTPGAELRGIDIRLRQARMYTIRGKVDATAAGGANVSLQALPKEVLTNTNIISQLSQSTAISRSPDYPYELRNLIPGAYMIVPRLASNRMGNPVEAVVTDADINGLTIPLTTGAPITGTVAFEGGDVRTLATASGQNAELLAAAAAAGVVNIAGVRATVVLFPMWSAVPTTAGSSQITEAGTLRIEGVAPGKYQLSMNGLPAGSYIKSARFGGQDALRSPIDLTSGGGGELTIVLSNKAADLTGAVRDDKAQSLGGLMVTVWSKEPEGGNLTNGVRNVYTDQTGGFEFKGLPPGDYLAAAWEDADAQLVLSRDFLREFASEAATVTLAEGGRGAIEAKVIPTEKIKAAEAKLP